MGLPKTSLWTEHSKVCLEEVGDTTEEEGVGGAVEGAEVTINSSCPQDC